MAQGDSLGKIFIRYVYLWWTGVHQTQVGKPYLCRESGSWRCIFSLTIARTAVAVRTDEGYVGLADVTFAFDGMSMLIDGWGWIASLKDVDQ